MRFLFFWMFLSSISALSAQECKLISETDPFTKQTRLSSGFIMVEGGSITVDGDSKEIIVLFSIENGDKCFDDNTTMELFFEGIKSKVTARTQSTMNCEGLVQMVFKNNPNASVTMLQRLSTKKVTHINFLREKKKAVTLTLSPKEQEQLMHFTNCVVAESKKLIK
ncbi:MAG: hypothetical protein RL115_1082 [Bacteroidota bacterium]|jgi:hypothetical protein